MGNWKSIENIKYFKENNILLSQYFLDRGYDFYVDGFTPYISFSVSYIKKDMLNGTNVGTKNLQCQSIKFKNYNEMISILIEMCKENYVFMFSIKPFEMRVAVLSHEYELDGTDVNIRRKIKIRDQKLNELLNE